MRGIRAGFFRKTFIRAEVSCLRFNPLVFHECSVLVFKQMTFKYGCVQLADVSGQRLCRDALGSFSYYTAVKIIK